MLVVENHGLSGFGNRFSKRVRKDNIGLAQSGLRKDGGSVFFLKKVPNVDEYKEDRTVDGASPQYHHPGLKLRVCWKLFKCQVLDLEACLCGVYSIDLCSRPTK